MKLTIEQIDLINEQPMVVRMPHGDEYAWTMGDGWSDEQLNQVCCDVKNSVNLIPHGYPDLPQLSKLTALILLQCCYPNIEVVKGVPLMVDELPLQKDDGVNWYPYNYKAVQTISNSGDDESDLTGDVNLSYGEPIELADGSTIMLAEWREEEHPRDAHGRFVAGIGESHTNENRLSRALSSAGQRQGVPGYGQNAPTRAQRFYEAFASQMAVKIADAGTQGLGARVWNNSDATTRRKLLEAIGNQIRDYMEVHAQNVETDYASMRNMLDAAPYDDFLRNAVNDIGLIPTPRDSASIAEALDRHLGITSRVTGPQERNIKGWLDTGSQFVSKLQMKRAYDSRDVTPIVASKEWVVESITNEVKNRLPNYDAMTAGQKEDLSARVTFAVNGSLVASEANAENPDFPIAMNVNKSKVGGEVLTSEPAMDNLIAMVTTSPTMQRIFADPLTNMPIYRAEPAFTALNYRNRAEMIDAGATVHEQRGATRGRLQDIVEYNDDLYSITKNNETGEVRITPLQDTSAIAPYLLDKMLGVTKRSNGQTLASKALQNMLERTGGDFKAMHEERKAKEAERQQKRRNRRNGGWSDDLSQKMFGDRSKVKIVDSGGNEIDPSLNPTITAFWGRSMSAADVADMVGAPDGAKITIDASQTSCQINANTSDLMGTGAVVTQSRLFTKNSTTGDITCYNSYFRIRHPLVGLSDKKRKFERMIIRSDAGIEPISPSRKERYQNEIADLQDMIDDKIAQGTKKLPSGVGIRIFARQVESMIRAGVTQLSVSAAGDYNSDDWNGYTTWAKFGYNTRIGSGRISGFNSTDLNSLMSEVASSGPWQGKTGSYVWEMTGSQFSGSFDLSQGSTSRKVLSEYIKRTNSRAQEDLKLDIELSDLLRAVRFYLREDAMPTQAELEQDKNDGFPMSDEDNALLDEIWKDIAAGKVEDDLDNQLAALGMQDDIYFE